MKVAIIIQARMTSTRLPGKVLMDLGGRPALAQEIRRISAMKEANEIMVATTTLPTDDPVEALAQREGVRCFRGDELDVLSRYVGAARAARADIIVRITADCPLIDPAESDRVVRALKDGDVDYASNGIRRTFPRGLDTEALHRDVLERVFRLGKSSEAREHVTWFIHRGRPELFVTRSVEDVDDNSDLRWTIDTPEDLTMARRIYEDLGLNDRPLAYREILAHVRAHPDIAAINANVQQKAG